MEKDNERRTGAYVNTVLANEKMGLTSLSETSAVLEGNNSFFWSGKSSWDPILFSYDTWQRNSKARYSRRTNILS